MNISSNRHAIVSFARIKNIFLFLFGIFLGISTVEAQKKIEKTPGKGGKTPNTKDNTTISGPKTGKIKSNTGDNTTQSQSGDNKRFPSAKTSTTDNSDLKINEKLQKKKQNQNAAYEGTEHESKSGHNVNKSGERIRSHNTIPVDQSSYQENRKNATESKEKANDKHDFEGNIVLKKKTGQDAPDVVHKNRSTPQVDHSHYQEYRKKAFDQKQSAANHLNAEGTEQYGQRPSGEFVDIEGRKSMRKAKELEQFTYTGDIDQGKKKKENKDKEKEIAFNSGDIDLTARDEKRRQSQKEIAQNTGDIDLTARDEKRRESQKEIANYSGDMDLTVRDEKRRQSQKEVANYSGDIAMHDVMKKAKEIRIKEKTMANYSGDILVRTLRARDNKIRIKAKKIANWEGDIVIAKKRKGAHPSAAYNGGRVANSYKQKEKYRKQMLKKYGRNSGMETPNYQRKKDDKPTYDKEESKIWDVQKYKDSKTKETQ